MYNSQTINYNRSNSTTELNNNTPHNIPITKLNNNTPDNIPITKLNNNIPITKLNGNITNNIKTEKTDVTENKKNKLKSEIVGMKSNTNIVNKENFKSSIEKIDNNYKFLINSYGHLCVYLNDNLCIEISNFNINAKKIVISDDGVHKEILYVIEGILKNGLDKKMIVLKSNDLNDNNWVKNKLGIKYCIIKDKEAFKYFDIYLSEIFKDINEEVEYNQVGWRKINSKYVYLHAGGAIGTKDLTIRGSKNKLIKSLNINQLESINYSFMLTKISKNDEKAIMMFVYSHLAVIKELFSAAGAKPNFVLWIYGLTGSMKTSVSKVFFNLFNRDDLSKITATFKDTDTSLELKAFEYKDSVLLIDDYHPTSSYSEKKDMQSKASKILRMYGDGISKGRSNKNIEKQAEYPPRGLCVITGEDFLGGESTISRYIGIEVNREEFDEKILAFHQQNPLIFSQHIQYFLLWISNKFEYLLEKIKLRFPEIRNNYYKNFRHPRFGEAYAILDIMIDIIFEYAQNVKNVEENSLAFEWKNKIIRLIQEHERRTLNEDPAMMYLTAIKELIESGAVKVSRIDEKNADKKIIGYQDNEKYYLIPKTAYVEITKFWKGQGIEFPVKEGATNKALEKINAIECTRETNNGKEVVRRTKKIRIGNITSRYLVIYKSIYNKLDII